MIRVQAGITRKRGLPRFSSAQASCAIDAEINGFWPQDPERLSETIRGLYRLCESTVEEELDRIEHDSRRVQAPPERPASPAQLRLIQSLARRKRIDLVEFLAHRVRAAQASTLTCGEASHAIDLLASASAGRLPVPPEPPVIQPPAARGPSGPESRSALQGQLPSSAASATP